MSHSVYIFRTPTVTKIYTNTLFSARFLLYFFAYVNLIYFFNIFFPKTEFSRTLSFFVQTAQKQGRFFYISSKCTKPPFLHFPTLFFPFFEFFLIFYVNRPLLSCAICHPFRPKNKKAKPLRCSSKGQFSKIRYISKGICRILLLCLQKQCLSGKLIRHR